MKNLTAILVLCAFGVMGTILFRGVENKGYAYDSSVCENDANKSFCFQSFYKSLVEEYDEEVAVEDLKQRYAKDQYIVSQCHPIMHIIGGTASERYPSVSAAYLRGDDFCWSGYYHGVMEGVIARIGEENLESELNTICEDIPGRSEYDFDYFNCIHGLGHGISELKGNDLFISLDMCSNLDGEWERQSCYGGVFMENVMIYTRYGSLDYLKEEEPLYPCNAVDEEYKEQCYLGQTSFALQVTSYDFNKVFDLCTEVEDPYRAICMQSMGRDAANQALHDVEKTKNLCYTPQNNLDRSNCIEGAVKEFISYYHDDKEGKKFCQALDQEDALRCLAIGERYYKIF
ncbi:MAG: hypothetical protein ACYCY6_00775 [Minisyncoccota bacterium]